MEGREASEARSQDGYCEFFLFWETEASQNMKKRKPTDEQGNTSNILHLCLGPEWMPPPEKMASAITME